MSARRRNPFDAAPAGRFVTPSLNQTRIVAAPGLAIPPDLLGRSGYDLLSAAALTGMARAAAPALGLDPDAPDLLMAFDACLTAVSPTTRGAAQALAHAYGQRLGLLLTLLKRGDPASRAARPDWQEAHWVFWRSRRVIWLGGGLLAGALGPIAAAAAEHALHAAGLVEMRVRCAAQAAHLPLWGVARSAPAEATAMAVFDFGQTRVKRGLARYAGGRLLGLAPLPALDSGCGHVRRFAYFPGAAARQAERMVAIMAATWREARDAGWPLGDSVGVSAATYLVDGHPPPGYGVLSCYGRLQLLSPNVRADLGRRLRAALGRPLRLRLEHDGAAAALALAGERKAAVILLGTALGVGFPPEREDGLRPLAHPLTATPPD
jgi:hypothetical protein